MSDKLIRAASRTIDVRVAIPWLAAAGVYLLLTTFGYRLLADPDTYFHIALGRWILEHHAVPTSDLLSLTMRGTDWVAHEWLSQVAYAVAYALGGWAAVTALAAGAVATAFGLLARFLLREWQPIPTLGALLAGLVLVSPHILARPHVLALPLMVAWIGTLIGALDDERSPPWRLLPLMVLWANLHGSFTFGLAMLGPIACEALWRAQRAERAKVAQRWVAFAALSLAAACLNPYGPEMIVVTYRTMALGDALSIITEWQPQDFGKLDAFEMIVLACFGYALYRGVKVPPLRILMLFGVLHLALAQSRHADLLGLLAPLFLARPLAEQSGALAASHMPADMRATASAAVTVGLLLAATAILMAWRSDMTVPRITPVNAIKALDTAKVKRILNSYDFGGYLDFVGIPPFIDGRTDLYGAAFTLRHDRALKLQDLGDFLRLLDEYRIEATLLIPATPAIALLDRLPDWQRLYADEVAVVHVRRSSVAARIH